MCNAIKMVKLSNDKCAQLIILYHHKTRKAYSAAGAVPLSAIVLCLIYWTHNRMRPSLHVTSKEIPPMGWRYLETQVTQNGIFRGVSRGQANSDKKK